jgi:hypothetical protein
MYYSAGIMWLVATATSSGGGSSSTQGHVFEAGLFTLAAALFTAWWQPWSQKAKLRRKKKHVVDLFVDGDPGVKGLIDEILPAPERVQDLEKGQDAHEIRLGTLEEWKGTLEQWKGEVDKTLYDNGVLLEKVQNGVTNLTREFVSFKDINGRNGGDGPGLGDTIYRIAKALGVDTGDTKEPPHE